MRLAKVLIVCSAIVSSIATASAKTNTGGGGGDASCLSCNPIMTVDFRVIYVCQSTRYAGRKNCEMDILTGCHESGDYCGFFFPSPNPVIA